MSAAGYDVRPLGAGDEDALAPLFDSRRNTRRCWCTAVCSGRTEFALDWLTGGARRRFTGRARASSAPMGVLASYDGEPVGWSACGPRARYVRADGWRGGLLSDRDPAEDGEVWLVACFVVREDHRGRGLTGTLLEAAVDLARSAGATAVEGWPVRDPLLKGEGFQGGAGTFARAGFTVVAAPAPHRLLVRRELDGAGPGGTAQER